jgi:hypothetical protein
MKKKIALISMTLIVGGSLYFTGINTSKAYYYGPIPGHTGSPFDGMTCNTNGCHNSNPLQSAKPWITSNVPVAGYTQDSIYTFKAKAVYSGFTSFGFQISPQTAAGGRLGSLIVTNATTTQIQAQSGLQYIEQTGNGYLGTDSLVWSFQWKAPAKGTGAVTFYGCFNCGNGNSSAAGTYVFPATLTVQESATDGISNIVPVNTSFSVFPNPAKEQINIAYSLKNAANVEVNMFSMDGRKVSTLLNSMVSEGNHTQNVMLPANVSRGIYLIQLTSNGQSTVQRIVVE